MNRRGFLAALCGVFAGVSGKISTPKAQPLAFHPDAFSMVFDALPVITTNPAPFARMDCLYGFAYLRPNFAVKVTDQYDADGIFIA